MAENQPNVRAHDLAPHASLAQPVARSRSVAGVVRRWPIGARTTPPASSLVPARAAPATTLGAQ